MTKLTTFLTGTTGASATAIIPDFLANTSDTANSTQIIIQIIIGIVTLFKLLKKKKTTEVV